MRKTVYLIGIILLVGVGHYMFKENKVKNVFDEMYYAKIQSVPKLYTSTSYISLINTNVLRSLPLNMRNEFINLKRESYRAESLKKNEELNLFFDKEEKKVEIIGILNVNEIIGEALRFSYIYYVEHEKMKK